MNRLGVIAKVHSPKAKGVLEPLLLWLQERQLEAFLDEDTARLVSDGYPSHKKSDIPSLVEAILVLGGDGTMLSVARVVADRAVPILGVNLGGLGFLTETTLEQLYPALEGLLSGNYEVSERMMLTTHIHRQGERIAEYSVLNDVVINKGALARIIEMATYIDGEFVNTYRADGLIISTPVGSTAYNLSAGGPILFPTMHAVVVSPICPHTLTNRPLVIPDKCKIEVVLMSENEDVLLTLDGQVGFALRYKDVVEIRKAKFDIKLIQFPPWNFYHTLRAKLKWGG